VLRGRRHLPHEQGFDGMKGVSGWDFILNYLIPSVFDPHSTGSAEVIRSRIVKLAVSRGGALWTTGEGVSFFTTETSGGSAIDPGRAMVFLLWA